MRGRIEVRRRPDPWDRDREWEWVVISRNSALMARSVNDFGSRRDAERSADAACRALGVKTPITVKS